jgi:hypothetical protein
MKTIFCLSGLILLVNYSHAQKVHAQKPAPSFTISAGISSAMYMTDDDYGKSYSSDLNTGAYGGVTFRMPTGKHWAVEPGLFYVQKGGTETLDGVKYTTALNYVDVPINMYYSKRNRFFFAFGPAADWGLSGKIKSEGESAKINFGSGTENDLKSFEIALNFTAGFQFRNNLFIAVTTNSGLNDLSNDNSYKYSNSYLGIRLGYVFAKKSTEDQRNK